MLDGLSLDQLRVFIASVDSGSFSAAARKLYRAQSAVSDLVKRLEEQMGVALFDRTHRYPRLTAQGTILLADARKIVADIDDIRARAKGMAAGVEAELSVVFDVMFPIALITEAALLFRNRFPATPLRIYAEILGNSFLPLHDGRASLGVVGPVPDGVTGLSTEPLQSVTVVMVVASGHPLAQRRSRISQAELRRHTQLVLTDRSALTEGQEYYVMSPSTWRLADLFVKRKFLLAGLGWGGMPLHSVEADIAKGRLVVLDIVGFPSSGGERPMFAAYPTSDPPGPAGRWLIDHLKNAH